jgi:hypothetical protein
MEQAEIIAKRKIVWLKKAGTSQLVTIKISKPRHVQSIWECTVILEGISDQPYYVRGVDSFQAICLALGFVRNVLEQQLQRGGKLLWSDKSGEINLDVMFS